MACCAVVNTLDRRLAVMNRIARSFARRYPWFEADELANQMWLQPSVRALTDENHLARACLCAVYSYFRHELTRCEHQELSEEFVRGREKPDRFLMDFENVCEDFTRTQKLAIKMRYDGFQYKEIASVVGVGGCNSVRIHLIDNPKIKERLASWIAA